MHRSVVLVICNTLGEVLLLQRGENNSMFPNEWCLPGGKVDKIVISGSPAIALVKSSTEIFEWERDDVACVRECIEETGIVPGLIEDTHITAVGNDQKYVVKVFKALLPIDKLEVTREFPNREHQIYGFFTIDNLPDKIGSLTKKIVLQVLKKN